MKRTVTLFAVILLLGSSAWAFRADCGVGAGFGMNPRVASLNLTDDQRERIQARHQVFMMETGPLRNELLTKREHLRQLWAKAVPDQAMISAKQQEIREIQSRIQERATQYQLDCRELLTPEQRKKLGALTAYHAGWRGGHGQRMRDW